MIERWPCCGRCSSKVGYWVPVDGYGPVEKVKARSIACKYDLIVSAECMHELILLPSERRKEDKATTRIEVPYWWGEASEFDAIASLVFFAPGGSRAPDHGLVTSIS